MFKRSLGMAASIIGMMVFLVWTGASLVRPVQIDESDGYRTKEYKQFGLIPLPLAPQSVPELKIRDEAIRVLTETVPPPPSMNLSRCKDPLKITRGKQTEYWARMDFAGDAKQAFAYYKSHLTHLRESVGAGSMTLEGDAPDGARVMVFFAAYYKSKGGPVAGHECGVKVTRG